MEEKLKGELSAAEIKKLKENYGGLWAVTADGMIGYIRKPRRAEMSLAMSHAQTNPLKSSEMILQTCWAGGCDDLKNDDKYFYAINAQIQQIVEVAEVEIKKL